jgi:hypothetical protein
MARRYLIETFGCQMNVHDSERMAGLLEQAGFEATDDAADADVVVINTCSVRDRAEQQLYTRLGELRVLAAEHGHDPIVAVAGCVAQQEGEAIFKRANGTADVILGTQAIRRLPMLVEQAAAARRPAIDLNPYEDVTFPLGVTRRAELSHDVRVERPFALIRTRERPVVVVDERPRTGRRVRAPDALLLAVVRELRRVIEHPVIRPDLRGCGRFSRLVLAPLRVRRDEYSFGSFDTGIAPLLVRPTQGYQTAWGD